MTVQHAWRTAVGLSFALSAAACTTQSIRPHQSVAHSRVTGTAPNTDASSVETQTQTQEPASVAAVFHLAGLNALGDCSDPILHGLDDTGAKIWSKTFIDGEVNCSKAEIERLAQVRVEHPHLALRQTLRFSSVPSRPIEVDCEYFGDCLVSLTGLTPSDLGAQLVIRRPHQESYGDAFMAGRSEVLASLDELRFDRLPIGRYEVALFRNSLFNGAEDLYQQGFVVVRPCQEAVVELVKD